MMRAVGPIPNATIVPPPVGIEFMGNEVPPEYVFDQGLNYPPAENYGYLSTAYESPGEWGDHHSIFGLDGQDLHYMGLEAESLPYVYYAPGYVYAQSSFNQYMPYVPGAITGLDGSFVGTQQYLNSPSYQHPISSPAYIPVIVQPSSDFVPTSSMDPFFFSTGASVASRPANASTKVTPAHASVSAAASSQLATLTTPLVMSDTSQLSHKNQTACRPSEGSQINIRPSNQSSSQEPMMLGGGTHWHQGVSSTGLMQSTYQFSHGRIPFGESNVKVAAPSNRGFTNWQPNVFRGASQDKQRQALQVEDIANTGGTNLDILGEQNKGPRKNRSKDQSTSSVVELAEPSQRSDSDAQGGCIIISPDYYNKDNFPVDYPDAKFFVIKSYSEDDVHKSVKYNVWSSTPNGNKRLDSAYDDAQRKSVGGKSRKWCPVFLFFSVNASGQFCGLAEMVGPVDFDKDMDFWQQDKWSGSFPVNWHIIKDVPNANLRHIILENNEHKPVTNSRDTQEIPYSAGINMLKIFKAYLLRTSILDDFMFYEERQKKMLENKFRHLGRSYNASLYVTAFVSQSRPDGRADQPPRVDENQPSGTEQIARAVVNQSDDASEQPSKYKEEMLDDTISRPLKIYGKHSSVAVDQSQRIDGKQSSPAVCLSPIADGKHSADAKDLPPIADGMQPDKVVQPQKADAKLEPTANPSKSDEKQSSLVMTQLPKAEIKPPSHAVLPKVDGKQSIQQIDQPLKSNGNPTRPKVINGVANLNPGEELVKTKLHVLESSADKDTEPDLAGDGEVTKVIIKTGMPSVDPKQVAAKSLGTMELKVIPIDFVKVGSLQIKVGLGESSSRVLSIGTMSGELKGPRQSKKGKSADSQRPTK